MFDHQYLNKDEYLVAVEAPLSVRRERRLVKNNRKYPAYMQLVKRELSQLLSNQQQASGIRVFTTFSPYSQKVAENAVSQQLAELNGTEDHELQSAMLVTEIASGEIKAIVGDKQSGYAGFNRALNAQRPIGSLIKPVIYIAALERYQQYQLGTLLSDEAISFKTDNGEVWQPKNYDGEFSGKVSLLNSLVKSLNIPTVNLGLTIGLENIASMLHLLGYDEDITLRPSMLLGSINMSPYQVNQLYLPFANKGAQVQSHVVDKVVSAQGETLYFHQVEYQAFFSEQASYLLDYALTKVTQQGTAKSLVWRLKDATLAGKTGTTNDQRDSWFVGYDDKYLITTWVGRDDNKATEFTGSSGALTLFSAFMKSHGVINKRFIIPPDIELVDFEEETGFPVAIECNNTEKFPAINKGLAFKYSCNEQQATPKKKRSWFDKIFN